MPWKLSAGISDTAPIHSGPAASLTISIQALVAAARAVNSPSNTCQSPALDTSFRSNTTFARCESMIRSRRSCAVSDFAQIRN